MNQIFKVVKNHQGNNVVASELAKGTKKGGKLAAVVMAALFTGTAFAVPVSIQGTATSENAVSIGTDSFATAVDGVAGGKGSVATGQGFNRDEFAAKVNEQNALLNDQATKQGELDTIKTNLEANDKVQENLGKQIGELINTIDIKEKKLDRFDELNNRLLTKNNDLTDLLRNLDDIKNHLPTEYLIGENKNIAIDFTPILNSLDYNKLNNTDGRSELAQDLKNKLEGDFTDIQGMFTDKEYLDVLNEFINKRSSYDAYRTAYDAEMGHEKYKNISVDQINTGQALENIYLRHGESIIGIAREDIYSRLENDKLNHTYNNRENNEYLSNKEYPKEYWTNYSTMRNNLHDQLIVSYLLADESKNAHIIASQYTNGNCFSDMCYESSDIGNQSQNYIFRLAPLNDSFNKNNPFKFIGQSIINDANVPVGIDYVAEKIIKDQVLSDIELSYIKHIYDQFNLYASSINYDSDKWIVDKVYYRENLQKVLDFNAKLEEYRQLVEQNRHDAINGNIKDALLARQINLKKEIEALNIDSSYFKNMSVRFNQTGRNEIDQGIDYVIKQENFIDKNLRYYDGKNLLIKTIQEKIKDVQTTLDNTQKAVDHKQREIDEISKQIDDLALTPDEKGAADLKVEKEKELADKQAEKELLEADKVAKENELEEINRQLANSSLKDLGLRSQAQGSNAFASGNDSIAIGTNSTVTANDGIVMGRDSTVTGMKSIVIGADNNVQSEHAVALGNNITIDTGFDGAVVLGDSSTAARANPTASMEIRGETYNFAGVNPTSTVSIGAGGSERQIVNVAAGRVNAQSTDAINGSQLYAVANALNKLETSAVNPTDVSNIVNNTLSTNLKAGDNITINEETDADTGNKTFTINAKQPTIEAGRGVTVEKNSDTFTINAEGKTYIAGDNVMIGADNRVNANGATVSSGEGITVTTTTTTGANGATNTDYRVALSDSLKAQIAKEESVTAGSSNVVVKQDGTNETGGKNFVVDIAKTLDLTDKGSIKMGDVIIAGDNVTVGGNQIHNVADGVAPMDAVNVRQLESAKTEVKGGTNAKVTEEKGDKGQSIYTVNVQGDLTSINSISGDKGTKITFGDTIDVNGSRISNVVNPINPTDAANKDYVDNARPTVTSKDDTVKIVETVANATTGAINYDLSVKMAGSIGIMTDDGKTIKHQLGDTITVTGDRKNISTETIKDGKVQVKLADDVKVNSVTTGNVSISTKGINAGGKKVVNVTPAEISPTSTDAVNGSQLYATNVKMSQNTQNIAKLGDRVNHLDNKINKVNKRLKAGIAGANAAAALPQVRGHGKSMVSAASGYYEGQNAIAVGYSRASDNGKLLLRVHANANTRGQIGGGVGIGYEW